MSRTQQLLLAGLVMIFLLRLVATWPLERSSVDLQPPEEFTSLRQNFAHQIDTIVPPPQSSLLKGIILGLKSDLPPDFQKALTATSTVHIVVASGQNLTILSGFLIALAPMIGRKKAVILSIVLSLFYTLLSGLQIPIIRAAIMVLFAGSAQVLNRESNSFFILTLTALLMLVFEPNWLISVSFQLSFLATFGVVIVAPELIKFIKAWPEIIKEDFAVSFSAQALTAPVIASVFHQFSLVGLLANILVLWTVPIIMTLGMVGLVLSFIPVINTLIFFIPLVLATYFIYLIDFFNQPWASLTLGYVPSLVIVGYYLVLLGLLVIIRQRNLLSSQKVS